ncbi:hypothetical protein BKA56DRAFT_718219 [Ilyonectria sp. MPI-CAGE-AT-0026]|nr:hypothetical protein BKA56DRAFT_718219 [Ilyonectria sp. MPI-CAGE-AT-0026]
MACPGGAAGIVVGPLPAAGGAMAHQSPWAFCVRWPNTRVGNYKLCCIVHAVVLRLRVSSVSSVSSVVAHIASLARRPGRTLDGGGGTFLPSACLSPQAAGRGATAAGCCRWVRRECPPTPARPIPVTLSVGKRCPPSAVTGSEKSHGQLRCMEAKLVWGYMEPCSHRAREQAREGAMERARSSLSGLRVKKSLVIVCYANAMLCYAVFRGSCQHGQSPIGVGPKAVQHCLPKTSQRPAAVPGRPVRHSLKFPKNVCIRPALGGLDDVVSQIS